MTDTEILVLLLFCLLINFALIAAVWLRIIYESAFAPVTPAKSYAEIRSDLDKIKRDVDKNTAWLSGGKKQPTPIIVCAAHRHRDHIVAGPRHFDQIMVPQIKAYAKAHDIEEKQNWAPGFWEQGFIDQFGKFYTRRQAMVAVKNSGQAFDPVRNGGSGHDLYSEGLY